MTYIAPMACAEGMVGDSRRSTLPERTPDLRSLDLLVTIAEQGSMSRAAIVHGISQPSASARVRHMERQLGVRLLDRHPGGARLTPAGDIVVEHARSAVAAARELMDASAELRGSLRENLSLAASTTIAEHLLPNWLVALHASSAAVEVELQVSNTLEVITLVRLGAVGLGFVEGPEVPTGLRSMRIGNDQLVVVAAPTHPWAKWPKELTPAELAAGRLIVREAGSGTRDTLDRALSHAGQELVTPIQIGSTNAIKVAVVGGDGVAVMSGLAVERELEDGRLVEIPVRGLELRRQFSAIWQRGRAPDGVMGELLSIARGNPSSA